MDVDVNGAFVYFLFMLYLTLNTGDSMEWGRERLSLEAAALLRPTLAQAVAPIPMMEGYVRHIAISLDAPPPVGRPTGGAIMLISRAEVVSLVYGFADKATGARQIWQGLTERAVRMQESTTSLPWPLPPMPLVLPWLAVLLMPPAVALPREDLPKLADYAACVATLMLLERQQRSLAA